KEIPNAKIIEEIYDVASSTAPVSLDYGFIQGEENHNDGSQLRLPTKAEPHANEASTLELPELNTDQLSPGPWAAEGPLEDHQDTRRLQPDLISPESQFSAKEAKVDGIVQDGESWAPQDRLGILTLSSRHDVLIVS